jgi:hypothetical protein
LGIGKNSAVQEEAEILSITSYVLLGSWLYVILIPEICILKQLFVVCYIVQSTGQEKTPTWRRRFCCGWTRGLLLVGGMTHHYYTQTEKSSS